MLDLGQQSSFVLRRRLFNAFMSAFRLHSPSVWEMGKLQNPVLYRRYLVMCIAVWWWSVYAAVCTAYWVNLKYRTATYQFLRQLLLVTLRHAGERKEQGLALRQEQYGCFRFRSFFYSFWGLCFSFSAAASSFVQDNIGNFQKKVCHNHCLADFFDPTRYPKR